MEELNVKQVIISKQKENSENYKKFKKIVEKKKIEVTVVEKGNELLIEKDLKIQILWPKAEAIQENILNNNSIVLKLVYKNFSILFTGDIEKIAEERILQEFKNSNILKSTILKVAHHGSKSSSMQSFLDKVKAKIALIGVGKYNIFGHPNTKVLERLNKCESKVLRTDEDGEITIRINKKGEIYLDKINGKH